MGDAFSMWAGKSGRKNKNRIVLLGFVAILTMATLTPAQVAQKTILVDDDGAECPTAAFTTIQAAVESASPGARILVCPGTYRGTVNLIGHGKDRLKIIAAGSQEEVVLQGDHMEMDGFHLEDVNEVLIQGFTIRDFGMGPTTSTVFGMGNNIALLRANKNLLRYNVVTRSDMMGIDLRDSSSDNVIEHNLSYNNDSFPNGAACGIMISGAGSARNIVRNNEAYGNDITGIMLQNTGADNVVSNNTLYGNGTFGITVQNSNGARVEGNRTQRQRGRFAGPTPNKYAIGIRVETSTGVVVKDNLVSDNPGFDIFWDNRGEYTFGDNGRLRPLKRALLTNTTVSTRNPAFRVGDNYRVEVSDAPANSKVYLRLGKDGNVLGTSGPYGALTDAQGRWSLTGTFDSSAVGSWVVQLLFGDTDSPDRTGVLSLTISNP
jgi:parallel beta-helix repeat protein